MSIEYIEDIQIFGMNMPFISSSEAKNAKPRMKYTFARFKRWYKWHRLYMTKIWIFFLLYES